MEKQYTRSVMVAAYVESIHYVTELCLNNIEMQNIE